MATGHVPLQESIYLLIIDMYIWLQCIKDLLHLICFSLGISCESFES